ncbi:hypothetical protein KP79_PYT16489 [Mizuhopecten yessoensis]|uniref:Uncharacterized protein n=1 Tax=Mizuhopecten yessoensis TaxID=6573 RepID=A0A210PXC6_MIZYE|nr:hypothetical protein KP79_PYT16489 [Mizuhopecten yessoensis]
MSEVVSNLDSISFLIIFIHDFVIYKETGQEINDLITYKNTDHCPLVRKICCIDLFILPALKRPIGFIMRLMMKLVCLAVVLFVTLTSSVVWSQDMWRGDRGEWQFSYKGDDTSMRGSGRGYFPYGSMIMGGIGGGMYH